MLEERTAEALVLLDSTSETAVNFLITTPLLQLSHPAKYYTVP